MICGRMSKDLALAATGSLDSRRAAEVRAHTLVCADCAKRLREYESLCALQSTAAAEIHDLSFRFRAQHGKEVPLSWSEWLLRWMIPAMCAAASLAAVLILFEKELDHPRKSNIEVTLGSAPESAQRPEPTLAHYRAALGDSADASLDSLLARDADVLLRPPTREEWRTLRADAL